MYLMHVSSSRSDGEQVGVARLGAAVAADVEVPALFRGDDAEVLALGFGAFADASRHGRFDFVRRPDALVAVLDADREAHRILNAVTAPGRADAAFHGSQRLAVGVAALEAGVDQILPDVRQLMGGGAEQVDALAAGDLRVEAVFAGHLAENDELLRRDLAARHARHHGIRAAALDIRQKAVVCVLNCGLLDDMRRSTGWPESTRRPACRFHSLGRARANESPHRTS